MILRMNQGQTVLSYSVYTHELLFNQAQNRIIKHVTLAIKNLNQWVGAPYMTSFALYDINLGAIKLNTDIHML